jgi:hypothetical protein
MDKIKIENIEKRYKDVQTRLRAAQDNKTRIQTVHDIRKRELRDRIQECKDAGHNPDTLESDINDACEVIGIKLDNFEADLKVAEDLINPMLQEIS